jgi:hypothetical protein
MEPQLIAGEDSGDGQLPLENVAVHCFGDLVPGPAVVSVQGPELEEEGLLGGGPEAVGPEDGWHSGHVLETSGLVVVACLGFLGVWERSCVRWNSGVERVAFFLECW